MLDACRSVPPHSLSSCFGVYFTLSKIVWKLRRQNLLRMTPVQASKSNAAQQIVTKVIVSFDSSCCRLTATRAVVLLRHGQNETSWCRKSMKESTLWFPSQSFSSGSYSASWCSLSDSLVFASSFCDTTLADVILQHYFLFGKRIGPNIISLIPSLSSSKPNQSIYAYLRIPSCLSNLMHFSLLLFVLYTPSMSDVSLAQILRPKMLRVWTNKIKKTDDGHQIQKRP